LSAKNLRLWNECLPNSEPFTKDEINELIKANDNEHAT